MLFICCTAEDFPRRIAFAYLMAVSKELDKVHISADILYRGGSALPQASQIVRTLTVCLTVISPKN